MRIDSLYACALAALLSAVAAPAFAQVPDNRGVTLDPEDSVPPAYRDTLDERDRQRLDAAREAGETFIPVLQGPGVAPEAGAAPAAASSGAVEPTRPRPTYETYRVPDPPRASDREERGGLVDVLIEAWTRPPEIVRVRYPGAGAPGSAAASSETAAPDAGREPGSAVSALPPIAAGRGLYARTLYAVNSDYPGPVLLEILEPPLAGAVAAGEFAMVRERLTLRLTRLEYRDRSVPVDAWAVGLDCACYGVEGEVESHWFARVLLPAAVRFAEGFLDALSRPDETVIVGDDVSGPRVRYERYGSAARDAAYAGAANAARTAGDVLLENAPTRPTVRIARDTELVVVFASSPSGGPEAGDG